MKPYKELADEYSQEATRLKERIEKLKLELKAAKKRKDLDAVYEIEKKIISYEVMFDGVVYSERQLRQYSKERKK